MFKTFRYGIKFFHTSKDSTSNLIPETMNRVNCFAYYEIINASYMDKMERYANSRDEIGNKNLNRTG